MGWARAQKCAEWSDLAHAKRWEGGNLEGARDNPVELPLSGRLVYSVHDYGPDVSTQPWFRNDTTSALLEQGWSKHWAYLSVNNIAPVWLGEFGTGSAETDIESGVPGSQGQWFSSLMNYLRVHRRVSCRRPDRKRNKTPATPSFAECKGGFFFWGAR